MPFTQDNIKEIRLELLIPLKIYLDVAMIKYFEGMTYFGDEIWIVRSVWFRSNEPFFVR